MYFKTKVKYSQTDVKAIPWHRMHVPNTNIFNYTKRSMLKIPDETSLGKFHIGIFLVCLLDAAVEQIAVSMNDRLEL